VLLSACTSRCHPYTGTNTCTANQIRELKTKQTPTAKPTATPNDYFSVRSNLILLTLGQHSDWLRGTVKLDSQQHSGNGYFWWYQLLH